MLSVDTKEWTSNVHLWITLGLPATYNLERYNPETAEDQAWYEVLRILQSSLQPGYFSGGFGRAIEEPETVILVSTWTNKEYLDAFEKSEDYAKQLEMINISTLPVICQKVYIPRCFTRLSWNHVEIIDASFASPVSDDVLQKLSKLTHIHYGFGTSDAPYVSRPVRGWVQRAISDGSQPTQTLRFINFWKDAEREQDFKDTSHTWRGWNEQVKEYGAISLKHCHCKLETVPIRFYKIKSTMEVIENAVHDVQL